MQMCKTEFTLNYSPPHGQVPTLISLKSTLHGGTDEFYHCCFLGKFFYLFFFHAVLRDDRWSNVIADFIWVIPNTCIIMLYAINPT